MSLLYCILKKSHDITVGSVYQVQGTSESRYMNQIKQIIQHIKESNNETILGMDQM